MNTAKTSSLSVATLAIGDELLDGRLADTNSQRLAEALFEVGLKIERALVVGDDIDTIVEALKRLAETHDVIVSSGGLGPTTDDLTADAVARAAGCEVVLDEVALASIQERFASRNIPMPDNNRRQAEVPKNARTIQNGAGISPAFVTNIARTNDDAAAQVWSFPGVPSEYDWFTHEALLPELRVRVGGEDAKAPSLARRTIRCLGITESGLGHALEKFEAENDDVRVQYRTRFPENHVRLVVEGRGGEAGQAELEQRADALAQAAREAIGGSVYHVGEDELEELVVEALKKTGKTVALAESCTGGLVARRITDVPGSSAVFVGGVVAYSNEVKGTLLDVKPATLAERGAVSEEVAAEMALGARDKLGADYALSVTGVAGPGGGTEDKPVGTVCFGLAGPGSVKSKRRFLPLPGRERIRSPSAAVALRWLLSELNKTGPASDQPSGTDLVR